MRFHQFKILLGGLAVLLAVLACSTVSPALPTIATFTTCPGCHGHRRPPSRQPPPRPSRLPRIPPPRSRQPPPPALPTLPVAASPSIQSLYMLDLNNGWALTDTGVVRTSDGGSTWYNATPAGLNGAPASPFFLDASTGWLAAGTGRPDHRHALPYQRRRGHLELHHRAVWRRFAPFHRSHERLGDGRIECRHEPRSRGDLPHQRRRERPGRGSLSTTQA